MEKKLFSGLATATLGTLAVGALLLKPAVAMAEHHEGNKGGSHAAEKSCGGKDHKGDKSCNGKDHKGDKSCSGKEGEQSCKGEKGCGGSDAKGHDDHGDHGDHGKH
jgi:hypothetical protein